MNVGSGLPEQTLQLAKWKLMALYKYLRETWNTAANDFLQERLTHWRTEPAVVRVEHPTRLDRAHAVGYKAKPGYLIVRVRVARGGRLRSKFKGGRKPKKMRRMKIVNVNYRAIAERRANRKFVNCEVLNSYEVAQNGISAWYEVVLIDKNHPVIKADPHINWICEPQHTRRAFRGLTSAGKKSRGLLGKGTGYEKARPSLRANKRRLH